MKILFKTIQRPKNQLRQDEQADYQSDLLFHGLRTLLGADCVDVPKKDYMYDSYPPENIQGLWGRGFTYSRTLQDTPVDRTLVPKDSDLVVLSVHHSVQFDHNYQLGEFLDLANNHGVPAERIAVVDGHDWPQFNKRLASMTKNFFKRELVEDPQFPHIKPVWFAFPKEKAVKEISYEKRRFFARIYPGSNEPHWPKNSRASHTFTDEASYYKEYQDSMFAFTCKKGGWDCMRHFEIIANGCLPIFTDLEKCPKKTCLLLPKQTLAEIKRWEGLRLAHIGTDPYCYGGHEALFGEETVDVSRFDFDRYRHVMYSLTDNLRYHYSTENLAQYFLKECGSYR